MSIITRSAVWGAAIFATTAVVGVLCVTALFFHGEMGTPTLSDIFWSAAEAGAGAGMCGALIGGILGSRVRLVNGILRFNRQIMPGVQYDTPQEGVWPPPPAVPSEAEEKKMSITIELSPDIEAKVKQQAQDRGQPVSEYLQDIISGMVTRRAFRRYGCRPVRRTAGSYQRFYRSVFTTLWREVCRRHGRRATAGRTEIRLK